MPNHEARARFRSSRNRFERLGIIPKYGKTQQRFLLADKRECFIWGAVWKKTVRFVNHVF